MAHHHSPSQQPDSHNTPHIILPSQSPSLSSSPTPSSTPPPPPPNSHFHQTWNDFLKALYSPSSFDQWYWIGVLIHAIYLDVSSTSLARTFKKLARPAVPCFAYLLIIFVWVSGMTTLYTSVIDKRWCSVVDSQRKLGEGGGNGGDNECKMVGLSTSTTCHHYEYYEEQQQHSSSSSFCAWGVFHFGFIFYVGLMVLWNFTLTTFGSPGVILPPSSSSSGGSSSNDESLSDLKNVNDERRDTSTTTTTTATATATVPTTAITEASSSTISSSSSAVVVGQKRRRQQQQQQQNVIQWKSMDARGGCLMRNPQQVNITSEEQRVAFCYNAATRRTPNATSHLTPNNTVMTTRKGHDDDDKDNNNPNDSNNNNSNNGNQENNDNDNDTSYSQRTTAWYFPSPDLSQCTKCHVKQRPPRTHHCSTCHRCVLQMDHHCPWVNNCIGIANYRTFLLTVFFMVIGCIYGSLVLFMPFIETLDDSCRAEDDNDDDNNDSSSGIGTYYEFVACFFRELVAIPRPLALIDRLWWEVWRNKDGQQQQYDYEDEGSSSAHLSTVIIKIVFPLLTIVGLILMEFLRWHVLLVTNGMTTLERIILSKMKMTRRLSSALEKKRSSGGNKKETIEDDGDDDDETEMEDDVVVNVFDRGWRENWRRLLGNRWMLMFLPVRVDVILDD